MSLGRKKKNSTLLAGSTTVRSLGSVRRRYPASDRISDADSLSAPLLGTATRSMSQLPVHVVEREAARKHEHLGPVEELADLLGQRLVALVFGGQPHLAGFLEDLLADAVHPAVQRGDGAAACGPSAGPLAELGEQGVEGLHVGRFCHVGRKTLRSAGPEQCDNHSVAGTVSCDPDGLRAFAAQCGEHATDVGVHRYPTQPLLPMQATSTAVAHLHDATERVAGNLAERIDSTAMAAAE